MDKLIRMRRKSVLTTACAITGAVALAAVSACSAVVSSATSGTSVTASPAARGTAATPGTRVTADPRAEGTATSKAASAVTIAAAGDTMLGSTPDLPPDPGSYLDAVKQVLDRGAQRLGNFAGYRNFATDGDLDTSEILHVTLSATGRFEAARISRSGVIQAP